MTIIPGAAPVVTVSSALIVARQATSSRNQPSRITEGRRMTGRTNIRKTRSWLRLQKGRAMSQTGTHCAIEVSHRSRCHCACDEGYVSSYR